jgi:enamine deaminase RidA (YjgF/YER057c/UK114 family)
VKPGATTLYLSGQLPSPIDPAATGAKQPSEITAADYGDTKTQTISTLRKIEELLAARGYTMADVIKMTAFVAGDPALGGRMDFAGFNEGFRQFFGTAENANTVARSTVQVAALVGPQYLIELEVVAAK